MKTSAQSRDQRLLVLARYGRLGASSRIRMFQYLPALEKAGFDVEVSSLFNREYLLALYQGRHAKRQIFQAYLRRLATVLRKHRADVIWLEKEAFPWIPWPLEAPVYWGRTPIVADYDDAVFHRYDLHPNQLVRGVLGQKIDQVMRTSDHVFAGNAYLAQRAETAGAGTVSVIPTVVDTDRYLPAHPAKGGVPRIGWIGTPESWNGLAADYLPVLKSVLDRNGGMLRLIGAAAADNDPRIESIEWSEETEVDSLRHVQIGIMPMADTPWSRGKCGYKLIQYMACNVPVIASPVGVNTEIIEHGINGFLARTTEEWQNRLETLLNDFELREKMGAAGRRDVEEKYSLKATVPFVVDTFNALADKKVGA